MSPFNFKFARLNYFYSRHLCIDIMISKISKNRTNLKKFCPNNLKKIYIAGHSHVVLTNYTQLVTVIEYSQLCL